MLFTGNDCVGFPSVPTRPQRGAESTNEVFAIDVILNVLIICAFVLFCGPLVCHRKWTFEAKLGRRYYFEIKV